MLEVIDPWGQKRDDHRFALLTAVTANSNGSKHPTGRFWEADDFMLSFTEREPVKPQTPNEIERHLRAWVKMSNAAYYERKRRGLPD